MNTIASFRTILAAIVLSLGTYADDFVWQGTCDERWGTCCPRGGDWYNNWFTEPIVGDCPGMLPGPGDHVYLFAHTVRLDQAVRIETFSSSGPFYLVSGGGLGHLWVDGSAVFDGVLHFEDGVLSSTGTGSFEINNLVEFSSGAAKTVALTTMNISPFARGRVADPCEIRLDLADLNIWPSGTFEFLADASIVNNPGGGGGNHVFNSGHLLKDGSAGVSRIEPPFFNLGVVDVRTGTLRLNNGSGRSNGAFIIEPGGVLEIAAHTFGPGATVVSDGTDGFVRVPGAGVFEIAGGAAPAIPNFWMAAESHVRGAGELDVAGSFLWFGGFFEGTGNIRLAGETGITTGAPKGAVDCRIVNSGHITWLDEGNLTLAWAVMDNTGVFYVHTDADIEGGTVNNAGTFGKLAGTGETSIASFANENRLRASSGRLQFDRFVQSDGESFLDGGSLGFVGPADFLGGAIAGAGEIAGSMRNVAATVRPGLPVGMISITGFYEQNADGRCEIDLAGVVPGTGFDRIEIGGWANLDGALSVRLMGEFQPSPGDAFEIMTYAGREGNFSAIALPDHRPEWTLLFEVSDTGVSLFTALPGDLDGDGGIALGDLAALLGRYGLTGGAEYADGDLDGDGDVDLGDLTVLLSRFGVRY